MNFHNEIMNIPVRVTTAQIGLCEHMITYKEGHRDARHAAAEIALQADERIEELEKALRNLAMWAWMNGYTSSTEYFAAEKALAKCKRK